MFVSSPDPPRHLMHLPYCGLPAALHLESMRSSASACLSFCGQVRSPFQASRLFTVITLAISFLACNKDFGTLDFSGMDKTLNLNIEHFAFSDISISYRGTTAVFPADATTHLTSYTSYVPLPSSDSFIIQRQSVSLAQVSFRPLRFPDSGSKDTTIVVREPSPGQFSATAVEPSWIEVLAVTPIS